MFKRIIASLAVAALIVSPFMMADAQIKSEQFDVKKTVTCNRPLTVINNLTKQYGEKIIMATRQKEDSPQIAIFYNKFSKTWTVVQFVTIKDEKSGKPEEWACILETGEDGVLNLKSLAEFNV